MSYTARISIIDLPEKNKSDEKNETSQAGKNPKPADFETAITAVGYGKFHYLLLLAIIPVSWSSSFDTGNMSMILPSAECDLQLTLFHKGILNAVTFTGMVLSGPAWGYFADVKGRRNILVYGYLADGICNFLSGFSQGFWTLVFFKLLSGLIISGPYATVMAYCSEFYRAKDRPRVPLVVGSSIAFGATVNAALAWLVVPQDWSLVLWDGAFVYNSWRIFLSLCGMPTLFGVLCLCFFPESPKFLMSQGRNEDALKVFKLMYRLNTGRSEDEYPIQDLEDERTAKLATDVSSCEKQSKGQSQDGMSQMMTIFYYPHLPRLLLVVTMQFCGMLAWNTVRLWQPQLFAILDNFDSVNYNVTTERELTFCEILDFSTVMSVNETVTHIAEDVQQCKNTVVTDSVYIDTIIVTATTNFFLFVATVLLNIVNHKNLLLISYVISFLCIVSIIWSANPLLTLVLTCLFLGLMSTTLNIVIGAAVILFPTSLRAMAVSLEMVIGRIGSIIGNLLFPVLLEYGCLAPIFTLAGFTLTCVILTCFLPISRKGKK